MRMVSLAAAAVKQFETWVRHKVCQNETRRIEEYPSEELDSLLAVFFSTIRKNNGMEYKPSSLKSVRQSLEYYLKEHEYPHSITASPQFLRSQMAYKKRCLELLAAGVD